MTMPPVKDSHHWQVPGCAPGQKANGRAWARQHTTCHVSLLSCFACCLSKSFGVMIDSSTKTKQGKKDISGEKGHLPLSAVSFLLHLLTCSLEICTHVYFAGEIKQVCPHYYLCTVFDLYARTGFFRITESVLFPVSSLQSQFGLWWEKSLESSPVFGSPCCFILLQEPGTIDTIRHTVLFEQHYLVTMEQLRQLLYVLCNRTNGSHS